jgi:hypothetical protein
MWKKKLVVLLLFSFVVANLFNPFLADAKEEKAEPIVLSLEVAQEKAVQNENSVNKTNRAIKNLIENNKYTYNEGEFVISDAEQSIISLYNRLKKGSPMNSQEYAKLYILYTMYGDTIYFSGKEDITKYINPSRFPHYSMWASVMKLSLSNQIVEASIKQQTRLLYDNILSAKSQIEILKMTIGLQDKIYKQQKSRYDAGQISKVSMDTAYKQLQIKKLELKKLTRTIDNLQMDLKKLTGVSISSELDLTDYSKDKIEIFESYDTYLNRALINRNEILSAKIDYWVGKNDFFIANEAFSENPWNINVQLKKNIAEQKIEESELSISTSNESVLKNINDAYIDVKYKKEQIDICKDKLNYENEQYRITTEKYKKQLISGTDVKNEEIVKFSALSAYYDAVRAYNSSIASLQQASKLGMANQG